MENADEVTEELRERKRKLGEKRDVRKMNMRKREQEKRKKGEK